MFFYSINTYEWDSTKFGTFHNLPSTLVQPSLPGVLSQCSIFFCALTFLASFCPSFLHMSKQIYKLENLVLHLAVLAVQFPSFNPSTRRVVNRGT